MLNKLKKLFAKTERLTIFILRRERFSSSIWLVSLFFFTIIVAYVMPGMFPTEEERIIMLETMRNPAMIALLGPIYGENNHSIGMIFANEMLLMTCLVVALMNIFLIIRHTRADEELGRSEVIRSLPVGPLSNLGAAIFISFILNFLLAILTGFGLALLNIEDMNFSGSLCYGFVLGTTGFFFACIAAIFSQLSANARGATAFSIITLVILYSMRAIGDIYISYLSYISPMGLILKTQVYVGNYIWPLFIVFFLSLVIAGVSFYLNYKRDVGQGFIASKPGKEKASRFFNKAESLSLRLLKISIITWLFGMFFFGMMYGSIMGDMETFIANNEFFKTMLPESDEYSITETFLAMLMMIMAILGTVPTLMCIIKLRIEEKSGRLENILARQVSRKRVLLGYSLIAFIISILALFASAIGLWLAAYVVMDEPFKFMLSLKAIAVFLPAVWFFIGLAVLLIGFCPKYANFAYLYLGFSFFVVYLGKLMNLPEWTKKLSPFGHIPQVPLEKINFWVLGLLIFLGIAFFCSGGFRYAKRDVKL